MEYERLVGGVGINMLKAVPKDFTGPAKLTAGSLAEDGLGKFVATDRGYRFYNTFRVDVSSNMI